HVRERDVRALWKDRMVLQQRPDLAEVIGADVVDPEDGVGIAHADDGRRMQDRLVRRPGLQLHGAGILEFLREPDLGPGRTRVCPCRRSKPAAYRPSSSSAIRPWFPASMRSCRFP